MVTYARRHDVASFGEYAVKTQVEFGSKKFPPYEGEEEQINPGLWGKRLTEYLVQKLSDRGIKTGEMIADDWGWYIPNRPCARKVQPDYDPKAPL